MTAFTSMALRACGRAAALCGVLTSGCVLAPKDLGNEQTGSDGGSGGGGSDGAVCQPGDTMPAPDGCNSCGCLDGQWACTAIGCDTGTPPPECDPGDIMPAADGCNECQCSEDGYWGCTKIACGGSDGGSSDGGGSGGEPLVCEPDAAMDPKVVIAAAVVDDTLAVTVGYAGGCRDHVFGLCWDQHFADSDPPQVDLYISHDAMNDPCASEPSEELEFDLLPLRQAYETGNQTDTGTIRIQLDGWDTELLYSW